MPARLSYDELAARLALAEETLAAIQRGEVDALVVSGRDGPQIYTLEGADAFYRVLIEQMPVGAAAVDRDGSVLYANGTFAAMLGVPLESLIGADLRAFASGVHRDVLLGLLDGAGVPAAADLTLTGHERQVEVALSVRHLGTGGRDVLCVVAVDLTQRRDVERALEVARSEAEQANRAKNVFLSHMSHELRTPLNAILGFAQLLELEDLAPTERESVDMIGVSGRQLLELINDVLDFAQLETGEIHVSLEPVSVAETVNETVRMMRSAADKRGIRLFAEWTPETRALRVRADRRRFGQILLNLVSNAIKYNIDGGAVTIRCQPAARGMVGVVVTDTGPGIKRDRLPLLFVPFARLGAERLNIQGTGLGLPVSRSLAEAMGGRLVLEATARTGSSFRLALPGANAPTRDESSAGGAGGGTWPHDPRPTGTVLYVEDNQINVTLVRAILRRRPSVELISAVTARDGFLLARDRRPGLIVLDLQLPDESGEEVLRWLLDDPRTAAIPVVIASADATPGQPERLIAAGASEYVVKPIDVAWLLGLVDRLFTPGAGASENPAASPSGAPPPGVASG